MLITKNGQTANVTKGAYKILKSQGWHAATVAEPETKQAISESPQPVEIPQETFEEQELIEESEKVDKPISEMTLDELIEFADDNNIDITGIKGKNNIKNAIVEAIR